MRRKYGLNMVKHSTPTQLAAVAQANSTRFSRRKTFGTTKYVLF